MYRLFVKIAVVFLVILHPMTICASNLPFFSQLPDSLIIAIDPGHGGYDPGAVFGKIQEKDINLIVCQKLKKQLEKQGASVVMTRDGDYNHAIKGLRGLEAKRYDLNQRIKIVRSSKAEILLIVHVNSSTKTSYAGAEIFFHPKSSEGQVLAYYIQEELRTIPEIQKRFSKSSTIFMLSNIRIPAVLIEIGYLSNPKERAKLQDPKYLDLIVEKIVAGIIRYQSSQQNIIKHVLTLLPLNF